MRCLWCNTIMTHVYRFTPDRNCELYVCKNCYTESRPKRIKYNSIEIKQDNTENKAKKVIHKDNPKPKPVKNNKTNNKKKKRKKNHDKRKSYS